MPLSGNEPPEYVKAEFGRRLADLIRQKGWNQSDLARQATKHMPEGKQMNRDNVSNYVRGKHTPGPVHLEALCAALRVEREDLLPTSDVPHAGRATPPLEASDLGDGMVFLRVNQRVPWEKALRVMAILRGENGKVED